MTIVVRGVRGATTVETDSAEEILSATRELLEELIAVNGIQKEDVASAFFTNTADLTATYPARAARELGWTQIALLGMQEMDVPDGVKRCIRILIHWNTDKSQEELVHLFLRGAAVLRPDLTTNRDLDVNGSGQS